MLKIDFRQLSISILSIILFEDFSRIYFFSLFIEYHLLCTYIIHIPNLSYAPIQQTKKKFSLNLSTNTIGRKTKNVEATKKHKEFIVLIENSLQHYGCEIFFLPSLLTN